MAARNTNDSPRLGVKLAFGRDGSKYICFVCEELMIYACQTVNCGHHFCRRCLDHLYDENEYVLISDKEIINHIMIERNTFVSERLHVPEVGVEHL